MKITRDIQSLSVFKRDTSKFIRQMNETHEPIVLTVNGKAALVVHDAESYENYLQEKDRIETIAAVRRSLEDVKAGRTRPAEDVFRELFEKFGIPESE